MSKYQVVFTKSAAKELKALPRQDAIKLAEAILFLSINPYSDLLNIKKLQNAHGYFRLRVQDYRIIYSVNNNILMIKIIKVGHRKEVYKKLKNN